MHRGVDARIQRDGQFAGRGHVESVHQRRHVSHESGHRIRLDGVVDLNLRRQDLAQQRHSRLQGGAVIGVERRRSDARGESAQGQAANE